MRCTGGCHCGAVRFQVDVREGFEIFRCNCSMCSRTAYLHLIVDAADFRLLSGEEKLTTYTFNTRTAQHRFCSVCGIKAFYVPRSHPDGYSVNFRCLDDPTVQPSRIGDFDGADWEANVDRLRAEVEGGSDGSPPM